MAPALDVAATMNPAPNVVSTKPSALASDMVTTSSSVPAPDFLPSMTPTSDLVEPVTSSETTKTPKTADLVPAKTPTPDLLPTMTPAPVTGSETTKTPAPDSLPTLTPATDMVEPVTGSKTTKTLASDSFPTMNPATDLVPTEPAFNLVTTKTVSDLVEPVDLIRTRMHTTNYFKLCEKHYFQYGVVYFTTE